MLTTHLHLAPRIKRVEPRLCSPLRLHAMDSNYFTCFLYSHRRSASFDSVYFALDSFGKFNNEDFLVIHINSRSNIVSTNNRSHFVTVFITVGVNRRILKQAKYIFPHRDLKATRPRSRPHGVD
jgi:hypothetical protein